VLWDDNRITIDGDTDLSTSEDILPAMPPPAGMSRRPCDGHDFADIERALTQAAADPRPSLIACRTMIGKGAPNKQGSHNVHGSPLGADEIAAARDALGWDHAPFEIPADVLADWRSLGARAPPARPGKRASRRAQQAPSSSAAWPATCPPAMKARPTSTACSRTRKRSRPARRAKWRSSADAAASRTGRRLGRPDRLEQHQDQGDRPFASDYSGRYVYYGIREFGMAAAMNGMALHGGVIPYGGTFLSSRTIAATPSACRRSSMRASSM
jgi:transketolase